MVRSAEKCESEIEIFTLDRSFRTQVSRNSVQKKAFSPVDYEAVWADRLFQQNRLLVAPAKDNNKPKQSFVEILKFLTGMALKVAKPTVGAPSKKITSPLVAGQTNPLVFFCHPHHPAPFFSQ